MSQPGRGLDVAIEAAIFAILVLSPLPFGTVLPWAQAGLELAVVVTAVLWLARMQASGSVTLRVTPLIWAWLAMFPLFVIQLLAPGWSMSPHATWESFRLYGAYFLFFVIVSAHLITIQRIVRLVTVLVGWGVVLAAWSLVNRALGRDLLLWFDNTVYHGRLVSTFVNANHQALYFSILLFLALGMVLRPARRSRSATPLPGSVAGTTRGTGTTARVLFAGAAAILCVAVVLTQSRAGVLSVAVALALVLTLAIQKGKGSGPLMIGAAIAGLVGYVVWVGADPLVDRFAILMRERATDARWFIWQGTVRLVRSAPFVGSGLGAFEDAVLTYQSPDVADRWLVGYAHNDYLQLLAEGGIAAIVVLLVGMVSWFRFVVTRWRGRRDPFVRGLMLGGLGAVIAVALHSGADFGLHMPANAILLVSVLALVPAVATLRLHQTGPAVDLREWRWALTPRLRRVAWVGGLVFAGVASVILVRAAAADWIYQNAMQLAGSVHRSKGEVTTADLSRAETMLERAARLERRNPRVQDALATAADELGRRAWTMGLTREGVVLRPGTSRERLAASQDLLGVAFDAYRRGLDARPTVSRMRVDFGWFLARLDAVRKTVRGERLSDVLKPGGLRGILNSDASLLPWALLELREATRVEPTSSTWHRSLGTFALLYRADVESADTIATQELRQALQLDPSALREVVALLITFKAEDLISQTVPRTVPALVELARLLEEQGRPTLALATLEDAVGVASTPAEQVTVQLGRARFALRRATPAQALGFARHALVLAPRNSEAFAVLGEAYEATGQLDEAQGAWESAVTLAPAPTVLNEYRDRLATVLARRGAGATALLVRRQIVQTVPNDPWARIALARLLEELGQTADVVREYETARVLGTRDKDIQRAVAQAFARHGLLGEAVAAAEQGVRLDPSDDDRRVELADLYARLGQPDRARQEYRVVLARQPGHEAAARGLRVVGAP